MFKHLLPIFQKKTGIEVRVVALGTGQALDMARRGDATWCSFTRNRRRKSSSARGTA
jgi:ABC-type tungstate transport system permease subunit